MVWQTLKQLLWDWRGVWITTPTTAGIVILLRLFGGLQSIELWMYDQYVRTKPIEPPDPRIVIVGINENDIHAIGQSIISDRTYAQLLSKLKAMQPRAIGLDIYRDLPTEPGHQELVQIFKTTPNLVGIQKLVGKAGEETVAAPPALAEKGQVGSNDLMSDPDGRIRRGFISVQGQDQTVLPSFGMYLAVLYLDQEKISLETVGTDQYWKLKNTIFYPFKHNDGGYTKAEDGSYQQMINYRGNRKYFTTVSMMDILNNRVSPTWAKDKIVLIGMVSESSLDVLSTPYTQNPNQRMSGVEIHANFASQIISAVLDNRPLIRFWKDQWEYLWIVFWAFTGSILSWQLRYLQETWQQRSLKFVIMGSTFVLLIGGTYWAFLSSWWIPVIPPLLALSGSIIAITAYIARSAGDIRNTFGRYLSSEIVATLLESPEGLKLGGERRKLTLFTSDLRGFTATAERLPPEEVVKILNFYLGYMADIITRYNGTIDEFMGDGILVLFGAPISREDDAKRSIACAIEMQQAMVTVNEQMKQWGLPPLEMGIGINTGEVVVGNIGSEKRAKYGVVGNQVNLTYRIESYTIGGQVIISETTLKEAGDQVKIIGQRQVAPKGVKEPITIYEVGGIGEPYHLNLPEEEEVFVSLADYHPPFLLQYAVLEGKDISSIVTKGQLIELSAKGGLIRYQQRLDSPSPNPYTNIKINLILTENDSLSEDIYGKILEKTAPDSCFYIRFTAQPPTLKAQLDKLYQSLSQ